jgi:hypothetical protein
MTVSTRLIKLFFYFSVGYILLVLVQDYWRQLLNYPEDWSAIFGASDGELYFNQAKGLVNSESLEKTYVFSRVISFMMLITGTQDRVVLKIINVFPSIIAIAFMVATTRKINAISMQSLLTRSTAKFIQDRQSLVQCYVTFFYPSFLIYTTSTLLRDSWMYMLVSAICLTIVLLFKSENRTFVFIYFSLSVLLVVLLFSFRFYAAIPFVVTASVYFVGNTLRQFYRTRTINLLPLSVSLLLTTLLLYGSTQIQQFVDRDLSIESAILYQSNYQTFNYASNKVSSNVGLLYANYSSVFWPLIFFYNYFTQFAGPFPWQLVNSSVLVTFITEIPLLWFILFRLWKLRSQLVSVEKFLLLESFLYSCSLAIGHVNLGTSTRVRVISYIPIFIVYFSANCRNLCAHCEPMQQNQPSDISSAINT